jgi:hypothetical protein
MTIRARDELFDTWMDLRYGNPVKLTDSERGRINRGLKQLRKIEATPDQLRSKFYAYKLKWPNMEPSISAIVANWNILTGEKKSSKHASHLPWTPPWEKSV